MNEIINENVSSTTDYKLRTVCVRFIHYSVIDRAEGKFFAFFQGLWFSEKNQNTK